MQLLVFTVSCVVLTCTSAVSGEFLRPEVHLSPLQIPGDRAHNSAEMGLSQHRCEMSEYLLTSRGMF